MALSTALIIGSINWRKNSSTWSNIEDNLSAIGSAVSLQGLVAFAQTVKEGSFAEAARELGLTPSAVAKSVARLEAELGLRLLHRTTRQVSLTSDGHALYERCRRIVDEMESLRAEAEGVRGEPSGTLRLNAPTTFGKKVLVPLLAQLVARFPRLDLDLTFSDRYEDIVRGGFDAAVRVGQLADSTLVAHRFAAQQVLVCASPVYLAQHGKPATPDGLAAHRCMLFRMPSTGRARPWEFVVARRPTTFVPDSVVTMDDGEALAAAAVAGLGLAQVPHYMAQDDLHAGRLVEVLQAFRGPPMPISLVYPSSRQVTPRLRVLQEALTGRAARAPRRRA